MIVCLFKFKKKKKERERKCCSDIIKQKFYLFFECESLQFSNKKLWVLTLNV